MSRSTLLLLLLPVVFLAMAGIIHVDFRALQECRTELYRAFSRIEYWRPSELDCTGHRGMRKLTDEIGTRVVNCGPDLLYIARTPDCRACGVGVLHPGNLMWLDAEARLYFCPPTATRAP